MPIALGSRRCASISESPGDPNTGGVAIKEEDRNARTTSFPTPSCSASSSIGKNSDLDLDLSGRSSDGGEDEVQSSYKGSLDSVNDLEEALPMRRGISRFYNGKSKSFTSLAEAPCIKEMAKPENAYTRKRKNLVAFGHVWGGISKRPLRPSRSTLALAVAMGSSDSLSDTSSDSTSSSNAAKLSPWRSSSVADLQQCSGTKTNTNGYGLLRYN